jgi:hypothetical protein
MSGMLGWVFLLLLIGVVFILPVYEFFWVRDIEGRTPDTARSRKARTVLVGVIVALAASCAAYKILVAHHLEQTSALFIGLPALLAILVVVFAKPRSAVGMLCLTTITALLMSGMFLGGDSSVSDGARFSSARDRVGASSITRGTRTNRKQRWLPPNLIGADEPRGVTRSSFLAKRRLSWKKWYPLLPQSFAATVERPRRPATRLFALGFRGPWRQGQGLAVGDLRVIRFGGEEAGGFDSGCFPIEREPVVFHAESDTSHIALVDVA